MALLSRASLLNGKFEKALSGQSVHEIWSRDRIDASLANFIARRPSEEPIWIFAYGSLMWNSLIDHAEQTSALLRGWHRSFCVRLQIGRATQEQPGRMLSLKIGGSCEGFAFRLVEEGLYDELKLLWIREMVGGAYQPRWVTLELPEGRYVTAVAFTTNYDCHMYEVDDGVDAVAPIVLRAVGPLGSNLEYLRHLVEVVRVHGISDAYLDDLMSKVLEIS